MQNSKTKSETGLLVLVVFALGLLVGGVGNHLWGAHVWGSGPQQRGAGHPPPPGQSFSARMGLSPDQQKQLDAIFDDTHPQFQALDAQREALHLQVRAKIRAILTPDQQVRFDAMVKDQEAHGRGGPNRGGPPPGRDGHGPDHRGPGF
ncbi:MAG TPA: periplasmic heavy metal sensor [Candidatus Acidoferrales bacterium]|nr:periplasmic heavy metal sensor [Candidatus Acidoferrales bacterium]